MRAYEETKYPDLFKKTYWGSFIIDNISNITNDILNNRNKFIEEFNIIKRNKLPQYIDKLIEEYRKDLYLDHIECYKTSNNNYIIVSSPYGDIHKDNYINRGWIEYDKLYTKDACTYIITIPMRK